MGPQEEQSPEEKFAEQIKAALSVGNDLALSISGQGAYEAAGKISMLCQAIRLTYAELEKIRATVPKDEPAPAKEPAPGGYSVTTHNQTGGVTVAERAA